MGIKGTGSGAKLYVQKPSTEFDVEALHLVDPNDVLDHADWLSTCPVDVSMDGGTEEADLGDRCNPDATVVSKITKEVTFNFFKKKDATTNLLPSWAVDIRTAHENGDNLYVLMLDEDKDTIGADGWWLIAQVTAYSENQPLTEGIDISVTVKPSGKTTFTNWAHILRVAASA